MKKNSSSEKQTIALAKKIAKSIRYGQTIGLVGDLGSGKTAFVKGLAQGLGITKTVNSPTFVLMRVYETKNSLIKRLVHVDAYRIKKASYLKGIGLDDYIKDKNTLVVIEWADLVLDILPKKKNIIVFHHQAKNKRQIILPSSLA